MKKPTNPLLTLLQEDDRYRLEAYQFVSEALAHAQNMMQVGKSTGKTKSVQAPVRRRERHLSGQQLCEAIRDLAIEQYGYMAQAVLRSWGVCSTADFGEIVYNLIRIGKMKKSTSDRREDFDNVYDFEQVFCKDFKIAQRPESPQEG